MFLILLLFSCTDSIELISENHNNTNNSDFIKRLSFCNEFDLQKVIEAEDGLDKTFLTKSRNGKFISMLDVMPSTKTTEGNELSYYEALGYDTLVPNINFAKLLNPLGELEVAGNIIRITSFGTYKFPIEYEKEFNEFITYNSNYIGDKINEGIYKINDNIVLYKTFEETTELEFGGDYEKLPDYFFGDDEDGDPVIENIQTKATSEPNFNSFQIFSADRTTILGKIIQNIIGSTKTSTIKFSSKRRVRGSFYFYNYGVYAEIGVQGWTDKKNWIGWSKTASDELRVGWNKVLLKKKVPDYYSKSLNSLNSIVYYPPQYMDVNGKRVNVATLAMPEFKPTLRDKVVTQGAKAIYDYLKNELGRPATEWEKSQAFIIATRTELYYIDATRDVVKYNTKSYTHVFAQSWMEFEVGWNNKNGFFINGMNKNNVNQITPWLTIIGKAFNEKKTTLVSGEVYICARFGNDWRGMKIIKKYEK